MSLIKKIGQFIDKHLLTSVESHRASYEKNKHKTEPKMISFLIKEKEDLKDVVLSTYEDKNSAYVYFDDYDSLINDLKEREYISPKYQEDGVRKDIMLSFYKVKDKKNQTWFLVIDMTNSPNIGLRDYWKVDSVMV